MMLRLLLLMGALAAGCDSAGNPNHGLTDGGGGAGSGGGGGGAGSGGGGGGSGGGGGGGGQLGCEGQGAGCYTVYAHSNDTLYSIDLMAKTLVSVGKFNTPKVGSSADVITDLAVAPDDTIYVISKTNLYTASRTDGHVTLVGPVTVCGMDNVAMTTTPDGKLWVGDFKGAFCRIDTATSPPTVTQVGTLGMGMALSGDLVAVSDGTVYGTAYKLADPASGGSNTNNILVKLDTATGQVSTTVGSTGFPKLFGVSYALGKVFAFTHDGSGDVITVDPMTGVGSLFSNFKDPATSKGIAFAGAGVNPMVPPVIQ